MSGAASTQFGLKVPHGKLVRSWSTDMHALGFLYMVAGATIAILVLRAAHGQWDEFGLIALYTAISNAFTALIAYFIFRRRPPELDIDKVLLVACYIIGIGGGAYFYCSRPG